MLTSHSTQMIKIYCNIFILIMSAPKMEETPLMIWDDLRRNLLGILLTSGEVNVNYFVLNDCC